MDNPEPGVDEWDLPSLGPPGLAPIDESCAYVPLDRPVPTPLLRRVLACWYPQLRCRWRGGAVLVSACCWLGACPVGLAPPDEVGEWLLVAAPWLPVLTLEWLASA